MSSINRRIFDYVLARPKLLKRLLRASDFSYWPQLQAFRNEVIARSIEGIYSAGTTLDDAEKHIGALENQGVSSIINFAMEAAGSHGIELMKAEYSRILPCLERHKGSCIALKPTSLIPPEKIQKLGSNLMAERYPEINLDRHLRSGEVEEVSLPLTKLAAQAAQRGVRLLIDAEQSELQPAVDLIALHLMKQFNSTGTNPLIYNTYQLYLQDSGLRLLCHQKWLQEGGSELAAKVVRGAYLSYESDRQAEAHPNYRLCLSKAAADKNYDLNASRLAKENCPAIFATHNSHSVELLVRLVSDNQSSKCEFAYLMGFRPRIAALLQGHRTLEYVPYGPTNVKIPYLLRRLEENTDAFGNKS